MNFFANDIFNLILIIGDNFHLIGDSFTTLTKWSFTTKFYRDCLLVDAIIHNRSVEIFIIDHIWICSNFTFSKSFIKLCFIYFSILIKLHAKTLLTFVIITFNTTTDRYWSTIITPRARNFSNFPLRLDWYLFTIFMLTTFTEIDHYINIQKAYWSWKVLNFIVLCNLKSMFGHVFIETIIYHFSFDQCLYCFSELIAW